MTTDYNDVPYVALPYKASRIDNIHTVAKFFGLEAPAFDKCRVLELGCATGANLIPMAHMYPDSEFVGIDFSEKQINAGKKCIEDLKISNIKLETKSILDLDESIGEFDYIIAHGVFSWVPADVQEKIFSICKKHLSKTGVAYVSYNTLPGWNMVRSIRDMMLYHTKDFKEPAQQVQQARLLLDFLSKAAPEGLTAHKSSLKKEVETLKNLPDAYLFHDHLETNNQAFYFHEFAEKAAANGLQYLGDSSIPSMFVGNHSKEATEILGKIDNIIKQEQYMDFVINRRFRSTLICHDNCSLTRAVKPEKIEEFFLSTTLMPENGLNSVDLKAFKETAFCNMEKTAKINPQNLAATALLLVLAENRSKPMSADELVKEATSRLENVEEDTIRQTLHQIGIPLVLSGGIIISSDSGKYNANVSEKPKTDELSKYQALYGPNTTNMRHDVISLGIFERLLIQELDGKNNTDELCKKFTKKIMAGELDIAHEGVKLTEEAKIQKHLLPQIKGTLQNFANNALLDG